MEILWDALNGVIDPGLGEVPGPLLLTDGSPGHTLAQLSSTQAGSMDNPPTTA